MEFCTGVYVGNNVVLTAAHCVDEGEDGIDVFWGNDGRPSGALATEEDIECHLHPGGEASGDGWVGVDLAFCIVQNPLAIDPVPVMVVPTCESMFLRNQLFVDVVNVFGDMIGMGTDGDQGDCLYVDEDGVKREVSGRILRESKDSNGLRIRALQPDPHATFNVVRNGDSGSPLIIEMPDGTHRVVGIASSLSSGNIDVNTDPLIKETDVVHWINYEPVPRRLSWVEGHAAGADITPCHTLIGNRYEWDPTGDCDSSIYPTNPESSSGKTTPACTDAASNVNPASSGRCAGFDPPLSIPPVLVDAGGVGSSSLQLSLAAAQSGDPADLEPDQMLRATDKDSVWGTDGPDFVVIGDEDSQVFLGPADDFLVTGDGDNEVLAGSGADFAVTGAGDDLIHLGEGASFANAGAGDDVVVIYDLCEISDAFIVGGPGHDTLVSPVSVCQLFLSGAFVTGFEEIIVTSVLSAQATCTPFESEQISNKRGHWRYLERVGDRVLAAILGMRVRWSDPQPAG